VGDPRGPSNPWPNVLHNAADPASDTLHGDNEIKATVPVPVELHDDGGSNRPVGRFP
jgi:hypothetical protein